METREPFEQEQEQEEVCQYTIIHRDLIEQAEDNMPPEETLYDLAELFKIFGDSTRVRILYALFANEMCVCDIAALLGISQSAVSHQLRILKQARLVKFKKMGKIVYYSLSDEHVKTIFDQGLAHVTE